MGSFVYHNMLFILGLCVGSFLGAYVVRFSKGDSVVLGRSKCDHCGHPLRWFDNIPLLSWVLLQSKCRYCRHHLGLFYPAIELVTGIIFAVLGYLFIASFPYVRQDVNFVLSLIIACSLIVIFFTDWVYGLIPDSAVVIGVLATFIARLWNAGFGIWSFRQGLLDPANKLGKYLLQTDYFRNNVLNNFVWPLGWDILGAIIVCLFFLFLVKVTRGRGMGQGDVKLAFLLGLIVGWPLSLVAVFISFVSGAIFAVGLLVIRKKTMKDTIHFGPFLVLSIPVALLFGDTLLRMYLGI